MPLIDLVLLLLLYVYIYIYIFIQTHMLCVGCIGNASAYHDISCFWDFRSNGAKWGSWSCGQSPHGACRKNCCKQFNQPCLIHVSIALCKHSIFIDNPTRSFQPLPLVTFFLNLFKFDFDGFCTTSVSWDIGRQHN